MSVHDDAPPGGDLLVDVGLDPATLPAPRATVLSVLDLAIEIAREGREGRTIGTLFVVGDHQTVLATSTRP